MYTIHVVSGNFVEQYRKNKISNWKYGRILSCKYHWYLSMINPIRRRLIGRERERDRSGGVYKNINFQSDIGDWSVEMYLIAIIALEINRH